MTHTLLPNPTCGWRCWRAGEAMKVLLTRESVVCVDAHQPPLLLLFACLLSLWLDRFSCAWTQHREEWALLTEHCERETHKHVRGSDRVYEPSDRKNEKGRVLSREIRRNPGAEEKVQRRWAIRSFVFLIFVLHDGRSPFFFFLLVFLSMVLQSALWKYSPVGITRSWFTDCSHDF